MNGAATTTMPVIIAMRRSKIPKALAFGQRRVSRGGSWRHQIKFSRCAARSSLPPSFKYADYGFRLALTLGR